MKNHLLFFEESQYHGCMFDRFGCNSIFGDLCSFSVSEFKLKLNPNEKNILVLKGIEDFSKYGNDIKKFLNLKNSFVVLAKEHEGFHHELFINLYKYIKPLNVDESKIFIIGYDINCKIVFEKWKQLNNLNLNIQSIQIDTFIFENMDVFFVNGRLNHDIQFTKKDREKIYVCYNGDPKDYRVRFVEELQKRELFDKGYVSLLTKHNPIVLDRKYVDHSNMTTQHYPLEHFENSYFSMVTESYFRDWGDNKDESYAHVTSMSEKIFKALLLNPFLLLGGYGALAHLKKLGFKTFGELFDEGYDNIVDPKKRFYKVLSELERVCNLGKEKLNDIYYNVMVDKVKFNQNHYINFNRQKLFLQFLEKIQ